MGGCRRTKLHSLKERKKKKKNSKTPKYFSRVEGIAVKRGGGSGCGDPRRVRGKEGWRDPSGKSAGLRERFGVKETPNYFPEKSSSRRRGREGKSTQKREQIAKKMFLVRVRGIVLNEPAKRSSASGNLRRGRS